MIEDVLFGFESYLLGSGVPQSQWAVVAMHLLDKKALSTWISFAQPLHNRGQVPSWEQFRSTLCSAFAHPDRQLAARQELLSVRQRTSVAEYVQRVRILVNRAGAPAPSDADLMLYFWRGLKSHIQDQSKVDPRTGAFWTSFESLARHAVLVDNQRPPVGGENNDSKRHVHWADKKRFSRSKARDEKPSLKALRPILKQGQRRNDKRGRNHSKGSQGSDRYGPSNGQRGGKQGHGPRQPASCPDCKGQGGLHYPHCPTHPYQPPK